MGQYDEKPDSPHVSPFESIRRVAEDGSEYWSARDLAKILSYDDYRNFLKVIVKARMACEQSEQDILNHFVEANEMGQAVRETIIKTGATLPEQLPTPEKSIKQLEQEEQLRLKRKGQLNLFEASSEE